MPELLAAQYPLRFLDLYGNDYLLALMIICVLLNHALALGCYSVTYISLGFDWIGVGHAGWLIHYAYRYFFMKNMETQPEAEKPAILKYR